MPGARQIKRTTAAGRMEREGRCVFPGWNLGALPGENDKVIAIKDHPLESEQQKRLRASRRAVIKLGTGIVTEATGNLTPPISNRSPAPSPC